MVGARCDLAGCALSSMADASPLHNRLPVTKKVSQGSSARAGRSRSDGPASGQHGAGAGTSAAPRGAARSCPPAHQRARWRGAVQVAGSGALPVRARGGLRAAGAEAAEAVAARRGSGFREAEGAPDGAHVARRWLLWPGKKIYFFHHSTPPIARHELIISAALPPPPLPPSAARGLAAPGRTPPRGRTTPGAWSPACGGSPTRRSGCCRMRSNKPRSCRSRPRASTPGGRSPSRRRPTRWRRRRKRWTRSWTTCRKRTLRSTPSPAPARAAPWPWRRRGRRTRWRTTRSGRWSCATA